MSGKNSRSKKKAIQPCVAANRVFFAHARAIGRPSFGKRRRERKRKEEKTRNKSGDKLHRLHSRRLKSAGDGACTPWSGSNRSTWSVPSPLFRHTIDLQCWHDTQRRRHSVTIVRARRQTVHTTTLLPLRDFPNHRKGVKHT